MGFFDKNKITEKNLVVDCNPHPSEEGILHCELGRKDENGHVIPMGVVEYEKLKNGWNLIGREGEVKNATVDEMKQIEKILVKRFI